MANTRLLDRVAKSAGTGKLIWIGLRESRRGPVEVVDDVEAIAETGLSGDRRCQGPAGSARQVTLIMQEHINATAALLQRDSIDPALLRRNLVVIGVNLLALRHQVFRIGEAEFEGTAHCHPCSRMDENLGEGGHAAMLGHGGICAKIRKSGMIRLGDSVQHLGPVNE